jgi:UDP-3-O-[3-hydroxymyristoyl] N-acetylglucosamine deacetylase
MPRTSYAQTLRQAVTVRGRGLHSNKPCQVTLCPVDHATGIRFLHRPSGIVVPASAEWVGDLSLATTLVKDGLRLQTVEHLLSALAGLEIDHVRVEVDAEELPILDGSAAPWVQAILEAGVRHLDVRRRHIRVLRPVEVQAAGKWMRVSPHHGLRVRYTIDFDHPAIGRQTRELSFTPEKYRREVGSARTFCMERDIEMMRSRGLALGGSLENAVVFAQDGPLNDSLRFEDEAVRHKILDMVGDLALLGAPLDALVEVHAGGHALHVALVRALLADPSAWTWSETPELIPAASYHVRGLALPQPSLA